MITEVLLILSLCITAGLLTFESRRRIEAESRADDERSRRLDIEWKAEKARMRLSEDLRFAKNIEAAEDAIKDFCQTIRSRALGADDE
jgi:hypothetical protein